MSTVRKNLFSGVLIGLSLIAAHAQYRFDNWTTDDGLPQNSVYAIVQTRDKYIWLATLDGLARFDGVRFTVFNKSNSPGISNNRFVYLYEDANGDLWAGTEQSGIVRFHDGQFTSYGLESGLASLRSTWMAGDFRGNLVVYSAGAAVTWSGERFVPVEVSQTSSATGSGFNRSILCQRPPDHELTCFVDGAYRKLRLPPHLADVRPGFSEGSLLDQNGTIWMPSLDDRLLEIGTDGQVKTYGKSEGLPASPMRMISGATVPLLLSLGNDKRLWLTDIATLKSNVLTSSTPEWMAKRDEIRSAFADGEGNLWFGTTRGGLTRVRKQSIIAYSKQQGLVQNNIYPVYADRKGSVWIGSEGLFRYRDGVFSPVPNTFGRINSITEDRTGRIIFAQGGDVWTLENDRAAPLHVNLANKMPIHVLHAQDDGSIWIGGVRGLVTVRDGIEMKYLRKDGLAGDEVNVIIGDGSGGLWIGSYGGLTHYHDGRFVSWTEDNGLPSHTVRSLYREDDGTLWIGTYDGGLARFRDGRFTSYSKKNGLYDDGVFQILEDGRGNFWLSSNRGIYRVRKEELNRLADGELESVNSVAYGKSDGMLSLECNGGRWPAGTRSSDGRLWFPTQDGVSVIDPASVVINPNSPTVVVESISIDNHPVGPDRFLSAVRDTDSAIEVAANQQNFEIEYTALSFVNSANMRFKYKLEGLNDDWIEAGTRRTAYYSFVPPGEYTFRVIAANSDGVWNEEGKSIRITVLPPFYLKWWFVTLAALFAAGILYSGFRFRINRLEQARKAQEEFSHKLLASQEQERQRIAAALHDSLGQSLLIIKNRIALAQTGVEEKGAVEEQLEELSHSATSAIDECREIAYNLRPFQISRFGLTKTLDGIFNRINEVTNIKATTEIEDIDKLLNNEAQVGMFRIVQECVNNIIKHSGASKASLVVTSRDGHVLIKVDDDGRGFDRDKAVSNLKSGFGLIGIAERVKMFGGSFVIRSAKGDGTRIRIRVNTNGK